MRGRSYRRALTPQKHKTWDELDGGWRLAQDEECIAVSFPGLAYHIDEQTNQVLLGGTVTLLAECGTATLIQLRITFPDDYPEREPQVYDVAQRFPHKPDRHFYPDGRFCLWLPPESRWDKKDPDGLCHFLEEVAVFLDQQLTYDAAGKREWPGKQRSHGDLGYIEFVQELLAGNQQLLNVLGPTFANKSGVTHNDPCPCGSGVKYRLCHSHIVKDISQRVGAERLRTIFSRWYANLAAELK
jgi:hypothetical protein